MDDPNHPDHAKVRTVLHDDPSYSRAFSSRDPIGFGAAGLEVRANGSCPSGSGRKYKKSCRQSRPVVASHGHTEGASGRSSAGAFEGATLDMSGVEPLRG